MKRGGVRGINNRIVGVGSDVGPHFVCARRPRATRSPCVPTRPVRHMPHRDGRMPARSCAGRMVVVATPEIIFLPVMQVTSRSNLDAYLKLATRSSSPTGADPPFPGSVPWDGRARSALRHFAMRLKIFEVAMSSLLGQAHNDRRGSKR
jgi:hypothetical protein